MPPGPLEIKEKSYLTDALPSNMPTNTVELSAKIATIQHTCPVESCYCRCSYNIYACWPSVTVTNTAAVQTCLLVECCCKMKACWTVGLLDCGHSISMLADLLSLNIACLLALCFFICYTYWYSVSLSAVSAGIVSHYQPCLLV